MKRTLKALVHQVGQIWSETIEFAPKMNALVDESTGINIGRLSPQLQSDLYDTLIAAKKMAQGDFDSNFTLFRKFTMADAEDADQERLFLTVYKSVGGPAPLLISMCTDRRTIDAQEKVLRKKEFVDKIAERINLKAYTPKVLDARIQGVIVSEIAGDIRPYAHFSDFLYGDFERNSATDGGMLYSWFMDDLIVNEWQLVETAFPTVAKRVARAGLANVNSARFLAFVHTIVHDTLGHVDIANPALMAADEFERQGIEELYADTQALWATIDPEIHAMLREIMSDEEIYAMGRLWFVKRILHYIRRGFDRDPIHGALNEDNDARTGINFYMYAVRSGVIEFRDGAFDLHEDLWPEMVNQLLDDLIPVFGQLDNGADAFEFACRLFNKEYGTRSPLTGKWIIPVELRTLFERFQTHRAA